MLARGLRIVTAGIVFGIGAALASTHVVEALLYHTSPRDPVVLCLIAHGLAAAGLVACLVPALRAAKIDPMITLRAE